MREVEETHVEERHDEEERQEEEEEERAKRHRNLNTQTRQAAPLRHTRASVCLSVCLSQDNGSPL